MERSDPIRKAAADPASAKTEPAKPAADGTSAPDGAASDHVLPPEPEPMMLETVTFEPVEWDEDTTQPVGHGDAADERPTHEVTPEPDPMSRHASPTDARPPSEAPPAQSFTPYAPPPPIEFNPVEPLPVEPVAVDPISVEPRAEPRHPTPIPPPASAAVGPLAWNRATDGIAPVPVRDTTRLKDLAQRAVSVAAIVFAGWVTTVLVLIVVFRFVNPPASTLMVLQWISGTPIQHEWVPLERISPNLTRAVIVAEDGRFCQHWGVDFVEMAKAIERANDGYPRGASTITMQVAKNLFLLPVKSYLRKVVEVPLTFAIELAWPKWRILEVYLNIAEWGPGIFGAEAAAQAHFGRPAMNLSARQAAQLAVVLPNPIVRDAGSPGPRTAHRASVIQARAAHDPEASACVAP